MYENLFAHYPNEIDKVLFDPWSGIHAGSGIVLGILGFNLEQVLFIATLWEFIENSPLGSMIWILAGDNKYNGDTFINILSDIFFVTYFSKSNNYFGIKPSVILLGACFMYFQSYTFHLRVEDNISCELLK